MRIAAKKLSAIRWYPAALGWRPSSADQPIDIPVEVAVDVDEHGALLWCERTDAVVQRLDEGR